MRLALIAGKATSEVEKIICSDDELSKLDDSLNKAYCEALKRAQTKNRSMESQREWLKYRNACKNTACLKRGYKTRINELVSLTYDTPKPSDPSASSAELNEELLRAAETVFCGG